MIQALWRMEFGPTFRISLWCVRQSVINHTSWTYTHSQHLNLVSGKRRIYCRRGATHMLRCCLFHRRMIFPSCREINQSGFKPCVTQHQLVLLKRRNVTRGFDRIYWHFSICITRIKMFNINYLKEKSKFLYLPTIHSSEIMAVPCVSAVSSRSEPSIRVQHSNICYIDKTSHFRPPCVTHLSKKLSKTSH